MSVSADDLAKIVDEHELNMLRTEYAELYKRINDLYEMAIHGHARTQSIHQGRLGELLERQNYLMIKYDQVFWVVDGELQIAGRVYPDDLLSTVINIAEEVGSVEWWTQPTVTVQAFVDYCRHELRAKPRSTINYSIYEALAERLLASGFEDIRQSA